jgi:hypothetical protein
MNGAVLLLHMDDYTTPAKVYWWVTALLGLAALWFAATGVAALDQGVIARVLLGVLFAAVTGLFPVRIPGAKTAGSVAEIFVFLLLLNYGPDAAVIAAAAEASVISWRTSARWTSRLGSPAMAALAMVACGKAFAYAQTQLSAAGGYPVEMKSALVLVLALPYFAAGTLLMASLIQLKRGEPLRPLRTLHEHAWLGVTYAVSGLIAGMLYASFGPFFEFAVFFAALPIVMVLLATLHVFHDHAEAEARTQAKRVTPPRVEP